MTERVYLTPLPDMTGRRWTAIRKAEVALRVRRGDLTPEEARARFNLSEDELAEWMRADRRGRIDAFKATTRSTYR